LQTLTSLLPPKKAEIDPLPAIVDEADYEESDVAEFQSTWLEQELQNEFDEDWEDEDDDEGMDAPECQPQ
jgi:DnaJ homolog subfamily A member 2